MYFEVNDAQPVHIELLPSNAHGVSAQISTDEQKRSVLKVTAWTSRQTPIKCVSGVNEEEFLENYCYDCEWHTEALDIDIGEHDIEVYVDGHSVYVYGSCY